MYFYVHSVFGLSVCGHVLKIVNTIVGIAPNLQCRCATDTVTGELRSTGQRS